MSPHKKIPKTEKAKLSPLQKLLKEKDVLLMLYSKSEEGYFYYSITQEDERIIYDLLKSRNPKKPSLIIFLDCSGGNVYAAVKIIDILRTKYKEIIIAIAEEAKSSATLMCLGADKIIMSPISELGPLDKPMWHPAQEGKIISALDIVRSLGSIIDTATNKQRNLADRLVRDSSIKKERAIELAGESIAKLLTPVFNKEDARTYNEAMRFLLIAENYGKEFLTEHMLKYVKDKSLREKVAKIIMNNLVWEYPEHGFAIRRKELKDRLFLIVEDAEKFDFWDELWEIFKQTIGEKNKGKVIKFL